MDWLHRQFLIYMKRERIHTQMWAGVLAEETSLEK